MVKSLSGLERRKLNPPGANGGLPGASPPASGSHARPACRCSTGCQRAHLLPESSCDGRTELLPPPNYYHQPPRFAPIFPRPIFPALRIGEKGSQPSRGPFLGQLTHARPGVQTLHFTPEPSQRPLCHVRAEGLRTLTGALSASAPHPALRSLCGPNRPGPLFGERRALTTPALGSRTVLCWQLPEGAMRRSRKPQATHAVKAPKVQKPPARSASDGRCWSAASSSAQ